MLEGKSAQEWIDTYLDGKPPELADVAEKLRKLMNKTVAEPGAEQESLLVKLV